VHKLDTPKKVTKKRGYRYCYLAAIVSSVIGLGNLHKGIIAATRMMWAVTPTSSFVAIMQQQWPVAARGANMVAVKDAIMMAATTWAIVDDDVEKKLDEDSLSGCTDKNQLATLGAKGQGRWWLAAGGWGRVHQ
jgi:hypothetical protein